MKNRSPAANTGFAENGVMCKPGALCFYASSVLVVTTSQQDSLTTEKNDVFSYHNRI